MSRRREAWTALSLAVALAVAGLDVALSSTTLIAALTGPPLLAAGRAGVRGTALVGVASLGLAVLLGLPDQVFGDTSHVIRCAVVAAAGLLGVWAALLSERLSQSRDQLRAILEGVADGVVARDPSGRTVFANRAALDLLGYATEAELLESSGEPVTERLEVLTEDGRPLGPTELPGRRASRGETPRPLTVQLRNRNTGEERWATVKAAPILDDLGRPSLSITIVEDVTEVKHQERRQQILAESGRLLASSLDYEATLRAVADLAVPSIADWCSVEVMDPDGITRQVALASADPDKLPAARRMRERYPPDPADARGVPHALRTGESTLYRELGSELLEEAARDTEHLQILRELNLCSAMVVPMIARGRTLGAITFVTAESGRRFATEHLELAQELAARMATALDNARLYRERSNIARALQESLLPPILPDVPGVEVAARFRAAGEGSEVGGDFYDLFDTGASRWAVVIGDVCGKGADAAAVTALARYTLRTAAMRDTRPSAVLATLNEAMLRQRNDEQFCTVVFASLELAGDNARVVLASGGHPLPILLRADGHVAQVGGSGTLLGVVSDPHLCDETITLTAGDALIFYTDGVTEAQAPQRIVTSAELATVISRCRGLDPATLAERLEQHAVASDREPRDDVAILALRLTGAQAP